MADNRMNAKLYFMNPDHLGVKVSKDSFQGGAITSRGNLCKLGTVLAKSLTCPVCDRVMHKR